MLFCKKENKLWVFTELTFLYYPSQYSFFSLLHLHFLVFNDHKLPKIILEIRYRKHLHNYLVLSKFESHVSSFQFNFPTSRNLTDRLSWTIMSRIHFYYNLPPFYRNMNQNEQIQKQSEKYLFSMTSIFVKDSC